MRPKTIARYGPARGGVRVFEDPKRQLLTVFWREEGKRHKKSWLLTAVGRVEALAYAETLVAVSELKAALFAASRRGSKTRRHSTATEGVDMVYIIRAGDRLKIGYTRRLGQRLLELQAANGTRLELLVAFPGGLDVERAVHLRFAPLAVHGEWFEGTPELVAWAIEQRRRPGALQ